MTARDSPPTLAFGSRKLFRDAMESPLTMSSPGSTLPRYKEDTVSLTSFNPFSEEDEHDQSSYAIVTSLFSKVKNSLTNINPTPQPPLPNPPQESQRKPSSTVSTRPSLPERPNSLSVLPSNPAPPLVSLTPVVSEVQIFNPEYDARHTSSYSPHESFWEQSAPYATSIPGFPIPDDARSIRTSTSVPKSKSVSKVIRKIRGDGVFLLLFHTLYLISSRSL